MPANNRRRTANVDLSSDEEEPPRQRLARRRNSEPNNNHNQDDEQRQTSLMGEKEEEWEIECLWTARLGFLLSRYVKPYRICRQVKDGWRGPAPSREQEEMMCDRLRKTITTWRREVLAETQIAIRRWISSDKGRNWIQQDGDGEDGEFNLPQGAADTDLDDFLSGCGPIIWRSSVDFFEDDMVEEWEHNFFKALDDVVAMIAVPILKHEWKRQQFSQSHFQCIPQLHATLRRADDCTRDFSIGMLPPRNSDRPGLEPGETRRTFHHPLPNDPHSTPVTRGIGGRYCDSDGDAMDNRNFVPSFVPSTPSPMRLRRRQGGARTTGDTSRDGGVGSSGGARDGDGDVGSSGGARDDGVGSSGNIGPATPPDSTQRKRRNGRNGKNAI